jgi:hypothetical protein
MLNLNTFIGIDKLITRFKIGSLVLKILMYTLPLIYYAVMVFINLPSPMWYDVTFLVLFFVFGVFDLITTLMHVDNGFTLVTRRIYKASKIVLKGVVIGLTLFTLYEVSKSGIGSTNALSLVSLIINIIVWVVTVIVEIVIFIIESSFKLLKESFEADTHTISDKIKEIKHSLFAKDQELDKEVVRRNKLRQKNQSYREKKKEKEKRKKKNN